MDKDVIVKLHKNFEDFVHSEGDVEFWYARDLQKLLGYTKWQNFQLILDKAKLSCESANGTIIHHFADVSKMIDTGKGAKREIRDTKLTRYACYLIAQNGDPRKEEIAFAQSYFAVQTRKQELVEERIKIIERLNVRSQLSKSEKQLSQNLYERGVDDVGFAIIRSEGDKALFGGYTTKEMKQRLHVPENKPLADHLPTVTITAKNLATEITNFNVVDKNIRGQTAITDEHVLNNSDVRDLLIRRGIVPENLPAEEDVKKLERKVKTQDKKLSGKSDGF
ncbi:MAG: DNA damage-inducible protein D [Methanocorpusculum sp.]|nr:DNA damage-inducible protein D [Methanocorpusculum sp.]